MPNPGPEHHVIADLAARLAKAERERDELRVAIMGGRADPSVTHGQFIEMAKSTEAARRGCLARAEAAERSLEEAEKVIKPFAATAEHDICESETDDDMFRPMLAYNRAPRLTVGHLRAARKWMESLPSPPKEG